KAGLLDTSGVIAGGQVREREFSTLVGADRALSQRGGIANCDFCVRNDGARWIGYRAREGRGVGLGEHSSTDREHENRDQQQYGGNLEPIVFHPASKVCSTAI